ncbi:MAG: N-acetylglucosamine-6-phosphate deacetylase [Acidobacteriota bacterium]|jgi:N-acetylglucosamine-6-phosphate deacetylase|nr:N-acetylglucosamine-6-phosphate deacetylase [Acidobacteriota bacterium]
MSETQTDSHPTLLLRGARFVTPGGVLEDARLLLSGGRVASVMRSEGSRDAETTLNLAERTLDLDGLTVYPGFIDVHIHGAVGIDALEADAGDLQRVARFLAENGVTAWLPTLVPAPVEDYRRAVEAIETLMREHDERPAAARAVGLHYEGPFVNERQCGALRTAYFRTYAHASDLDALPTLDAAGAAHMITLAPEIDGGVELVRELTRRGWVVSIGHTRANVETLERARVAGARHMTHFLNAMSPLHQREPGPVGWGLLRDDVTVDLIADGVHSDPLMLRLVLRCKTPARVSLISDAVAPAGLGDGEYRVWGENISVREGRTRNERGSIAGSVITMLDAVHTARALDLGEVEVARVASLNPALLLGIDDECGSIEEGKRADLTALDADGRVRLTLIGGRVAFDGLKTA